METGNKPKLNVEHILNEVDKNFHFSKNAKGRKLVLILGSTGVGKSTTCCALVGHRMRLTIDGEIESVHETDIKIGHQYESETSYAKVFLADDPTCPGQQIGFLDTPGFEDNRFTETIIISSVSMELAVRYAFEETANQASGGGVKGFLIVMSYLDLMHPRPPLLKSLVQSLVFLFKDPIKMLQYSFFLITHCKKPVKESKDIIVKRLKYLKEYFERQLESCHTFSLNDDIKPMEYVRMAEFLSAVIKSQDRIIFFNPLDGGVSRQLVFEKIKDLRPSEWYIADLMKTVKDMFGNSLPQEHIKITIEDFNFLECNSERIKFNNVMHHRVCDGRNLIEIIKRKASKYQELNSEIPELQDRLSCWKKSLPVLKEDVRSEAKSKSKEQLKTFKALESKVKEITAAISRKESAIVRKNEEKDRLREELASIDNDKPVLFNYDYINKYVFILKLWGWETKTFKFDTGDPSVEIIDVKTSKENGEWYDEEYLRGKSYYSITYKSDYRARPAKARVDTYIKSKYDSGNMKRIEEIHNSIAALDNDISTLMNENVALREEQLTLQYFVNMARGNLKSDERNVRTKLKECETDIQNYTLKLQEACEARDDNKRAGLEAVREFEANKCKFDLIVNVANLIKFSHHLVRKFSVEYTKFLNDFAWYKNIFNENVTSDSTNRPVENGNSFELFDPITKKTIKELVVTDVGTAFDECSLLMQFDPIDHNSPFLFNHSDGTVEEIRYLRWKKVRNVQEYIEKLRIRNNALCQSSAEENSIFSSLGEIESRSNAELVEQAEKLKTEIQNLKEEIIVRETVVEKIMMHLSKRDETRITSSVQE